MLKNQIIAACKRNKYDPVPFKDLFDLCRLENDHETNKFIRQNSTERIRSGACDTRFYELYRHSLLFDSTVDFDAFCQYMEIDRDPNKRFYLPRRKTLLPAVRGYQAVLDKKVDIFTNSQPKRTGKSQIEILFVLMLSGLRPDHSSLMEGMGTGLVDSFYKGFLEYCDDTEQYRLRDIFPGLDVSSRNADMRTVNLVGVRRFPTLMCRSIDAVQVGLSEATNVLVLDDCVEGYEEAQSYTRLEQKWKVISGDIIGRAIEGTPIVMTGTRYSLRDPIGRMQEEALKMNKRLLINEIPALNEDDESNFEFIREGNKVFTTEYFRSQRIMLSPEQFASEFQQQPIEKEGIIYPKDDLNTYFELPDKIDGIIAVCDTAERGTDSTSMPIGYISGDDVYIHDVVFDNSLPEITKPECANALVRNKVQEAVFESNNAGDYFARDVNELVKKLHGTTSIKTKRTQANKETKILLSSDWVLHHCYFLHSSKYDPNSQYARFIRELTTYTAKGRNLHDDAADSMAMLKERVDNIQKVRCQIIDRPF